MRNAFNNGLSVAQFAEVIGLNGWLMGGFGENLPVFGETKGCDCSGKCWFEYAYQRDTLSRYDVMQAIARAEAEFAKHIGYYPSPHYLEGVEARYPGGANYRGNALLNPNGKHKVVKLPFGKVIGVGKRTCELLGEADVVYETLLDLKVTNDTGQEFDVPDTFTAQLTGVTGVVDVAQIEAYFTETDRLGQPLDEWRIQPVTVSYDAKAGTSASISIKTANNSTGTVSQSPSELIGTLTEELKAQGYTVYADDANAFHFTYTSGGFGSRSGTSLRVTLSTVPV